MSVTAQQISGKERTRGPNLAILVRRSAGVPMEEALARADNAGAVIASNKRLSKALVGSDEWQGIREVFACWTGTMTAYDKPDQKLGKIIEYTDSETGVRYVFPVPEEHWGKTNVILVAEHPGVSLVKDGNDRIVQAIGVDIVERFPTSEEGWFLGDPKYDVPQGNKVDSSNQDARYLWRIDKRVGLVARGYDGGGWGGGGGRDVLLGGAPSGAFGVAVEATDANVASDIAPLVRSAEQSGAAAPRDVEITSSGSEVDNGSPYRGVPTTSLIHLPGTVIEAAESEYERISQVLRPEQITAYRRLLDSLKIKE